MVETPGKMYALATVLTLLAVVAVLLRLYARKIKKVVLAWDDYLIISALVGRAARLMHFPSYISWTDEGGPSSSRLVPCCV